MRHTPQHPNAFRNALLVSAATLLSLAPGALHGAQGNALELAGLWGAKLRFGPDIPGPLAIQLAARAWAPEMGGGTTPARGLGGPLRLPPPHARRAVPGPPSSWR